MIVRFAALTAFVLTACASDFGEVETPQAEPPAAMSTPLPLLKATFEPASPDCNGWLSEGARSIRSIPARSGAYACKLCADGTRGDFALSHEIDAPKSGRYVFRAYTRKRPQNEAPISTNAFVEAKGRDGSIVVAANETRVRDEWDLLEAIVDVPEDATALRVQIGAPAASTDQCIVVDDVSIEAL